MFLGPVPVLDLEPHILAILGASSMASGTLLVVWGASKLGSRRLEERGESFLAPTLAVDALDADLRVTYMQTLVVDARCNARYGAETAHVWSPLGREIRRSLVAIQGARHAAEIEAPPAPLEELLDSASRHVQNGRPLDANWDALVGRAKGQRR